MWNNFCSSLKKFHYSGWFTTSKDNPVKVLWFSPCNKRGKIVIATEPCVFIGGLSIDLHSENMDIANKVLSKSIFYLVEYESTKQIYDLAINICDMESAAGHTQSSYCEPLGGCLEDGIIIDKDEANVTVACGPTVYDLPVSYFNDKVELLQCASFTLNAPRGIAAIDHKSGNFSVWDLCIWDVHYPKLKFAPWLANSGFYYYYSPECSLVNSRNSSRSNSICDNNFSSRSSSRRNSACVNSRNSSRRNSICDNFSSRSSSRRNSACENFDSQSSSNGNLCNSTSTNNLKRKCNSSWRSKKCQKIQSEKRALLYSEAVKIPKIGSINKENE